MTAACPICSAPQVHGLTCHACTSAIERDLSDLPAIVDELHVTLARQARIGVAGRTAAPPRELWAYHPGASATLDDLTNTLTTWARDIAGENAVGSAMVYRSRDALAVGPFHLRCPHDSCRIMRTTVTKISHPAVVAARALLSSINDIRAHPAAAELMDEVHNAVTTARHAVDRPADRKFVGPCLHDEAGVVCQEDLYARHGADLVRCRVCGTEHPVIERRAWLLEQAADRLFTVREAAQMVGDVGGIKVTEASIRGYIHRTGNALAYRPGTKLIRLGDLLAVVVAAAEERAG